MHCGQMKRGLSEAVGKPQPELAAADREMHDLAQSHVLGILGTECIARLHHLLCRRPCAYPVVLCQAKYRCCKEQKCDCKDVITRFAGIQVNDACRQHASIVSFTFYGLNPVCQNVEQMSITPCLV